MQLSLNKKPGTKRQNARRYRTLYYTEDPAAERQRIANNITEQASQSRQTFDNLPPPKLEIHPPQTRSELTITESFAVLREYIQQQKLIDNPIYESPSEDDTVTCRNCHSYLSEDYARGESVCKQCAFTQVTTIIDEYAEWNSYQNDDGSSKKSTERCGPPNQNIYLSQNTIGATAIQATGRRNKKHDAMIRISMQNRMPYNEKVLLDLHAWYSTHFEEAGIHIPQSVIQTAVLLFRNYRSMPNLRTGKPRMNRGKSLRSIHLACFMRACQQHNVVMTADRLARVFKTTKREVSAGDLLLLEYNSVLNLNSIKITQPKDLIPEMCANLGLSYDLRLQITRFLEDIESVVASEPTLCTVRPQCVAAAAIWFMVMRVGLDVSVQGHPGLSCAKMAALTCVSESTFVPIYQQFVQLVAEDETLTQWRSPV